MLRKGQPEKELFAQFDLSVEIYHLKQTVGISVDQVNPDQFMNSTEDELVEYFVSRLSYDPLVIYEDHIDMDPPKECLVKFTDPTGRRLAGKGPGVEFMFHIPFSGKSRLWEARPSSHFGIFPFGWVGKEPDENGLGDLVHIVAKPATGRRGEIEQNWKQNLDLIKKYLEAQRRDIEQFHSQLPDEMRQAVRARRERIERFQGLSESLGIPLRLKGGAPPLEPIKIKKKITVNLPPPPKSGYKAEPGITDEIYQAILKMIRYTLRTWETTPKPYSLHGEEDLRDMILAHLNGHFVKEASGETFRVKGKTDILIQEKDGCAFIGECKVWHGTKQVSEAVDQLLNYHTWRDCKSALIVFNKDVAGFTGLLDKMPEALGKHPLIVRDLGTQSQGEWRYVFRTKEDEGRRVTVQAFLVNLHVDGA